MTKLFLSFKKLEAHYIMFSGKKIFCNSKGEVIKFKSLSFVKKILQELKYIKTIKDFNSNNIIRLLIFSNEIKKSTVCDEISNYLETDTLLYRANMGTELEASQKESWDPLVNYVKKKYMMDFIFQYGVMPIAQDKKNNKILISLLLKLSKKELTVFYFLTKITNSVIIVLNLLEGAMNVEEAWHSANKEYYYNVSEWGEPKDEKKKLSLKKLFYLDIIKFSNLLKE